MSEPIPRRHRFQFSLRTLFILAVLVGLVSLAILQRIQVERQEIESAELRALVAALNAQNAVLERNLDATRRWVDGIASDNRRLEAEAERDRLEAAKNPGRLPHFQREIRER